MNLSDAFFRHASDRPREVALWIDGGEWGYGQLARMARDKSTDPDSEIPPFYHIPVGRYTDILAALYAGVAYVPLPAGCLGGDLRPFAYIMHTSGSTGEPKGVPITHENALAYVEHTAERMGVTSADRFTQMHDLTFDFSVHDVWVPWNRGASVYVVPRNERFAPAGFIQEHEITCFAAVPSVLTSMSRLGLLKPGSLLSLRWAVFCGEPLPMGVTQEFVAAAPNCTVENIYGPTECTVAVTSYRWHEGSPDECRNGLVPIGKPFPGHETKIVDGELWIRGPQVFGGYWPNGGGLTGDWYLTGDIVEEVGGLLHFVGRKDHQVQVRGHRVELGEVEAAYRAHDVEAVCIGWPVRDGVVSGIAAFTLGNAPPLDDVFDGWPRYKRPSLVMPVTEFPKNRNGKVDRSALCDRLSEGVLA